MKNQPFCQRGDDLQDVKTVRIMCGVCFESGNTQMRSGVSLIPGFAVEIPAGGRGYPIGLSKEKKRTGNYDFNTK
mgnify:CR=1 FL=1